MNVETGGVGKGQNQECEITKDSRVKLDLDIDSKRLELADLHKQIERNYFTIESCVTYKFVICYLSLKA
jgi:hypothetical protein